MYNILLWNRLRLKISSLVKPNNPESSFLSEKPKLTKIVAYNDVLDYNSQAKHIFNQIKNQ